MNIKIFCRCSLFHFLVGLRTYQHSCKVQLSNVTSATWNKDMTGDVMSHFIVSQSLCVLVLREVTCPHLRRAEVQTLGILQPHAESGRLRQHFEEPITVSSAPYTLSVKLSDFTVWRHSWRKNWVNCAVLTGSSAGLRTALYGRLSHRTAQFTQGIPQFPQLTCRNHDGIISRHIRF